MAGPRRRGRRRPPRSGAVARPFGVRSLRAQGSRRRRERRLSRSAQRSFRERKQDSSRRLTRRRSAREPLGRSRCARSRQAGRAVPFCALPIGAQRVASRSPAHLAWQACEPTVARRPPKHSSTTVGLWRSEIARNAVASSTAFHSRPPTLWKLLPTTRNDREASTTCKSRPWSLAESPAFCLAKSHS
jgi:hypothetical protein